MAASSDDFPVPPDKSFEIFERNVGRISPDSLLFLIGFAHLSTRLIVSYIILCVNQSRGLNTGWGRRNPYGEPFTLTPGFYPELAGRVEWPAPPPPLRTGKMPVPHLLSPPQSSDSFHLPGRYAHAASRVNEVNRDSPESGEAEGT